MKNFFNLDLRTVLIIVLIVGIIIGGSIMSSRIDKLHEKNRIETNLKNALQDSVRTYRNKEGLLVSEKLTLQASVKSLEDENLNLSDNQKKLIAKIKEVEKENNIIAAALINQTATIDSLESVATNIDTANNKIHFVMNTDSIKYDITVKNVKPIGISKLKPILSINKMIIPNEQFIEFHWEDGETYPIAFSVTNSNPIFKVADIDSYVIPEVQKDKIKPNGWQKIKKWFKDNGKKIGIFFGGAVVGGLVVAGSK